MEGRDLNQALGRNGRAENIVTKLLLAVFSAIVKNIGVAELRNRREVERSKSTSA